MTPWPQVLRLQFVLGDDLASRVIAWWGQGYGGYSHVDVLLPTGELVGARDDEIGGVPPGVQKRPPDYEKWKRRTVISIPVSVEELSRANAFIARQIGRQYDQQAIVGFVLGQRRHGEGRWICSAFVTAVMQAMGRLRTLTVLPHQVPPNGAFLIAEALGGHVILDR